MNKLKKVVSLLLVMALTAAVAVGTTVAFLTDDEEAVNQMTMGNVDITLNEKETNTDGDLVDFTQDKPLYPAYNEPTEKNAETGLYEHDQVVDKIVSVTNTGTNGAFVRIFFAFEVGDYDATKLSDVIKVNKNETDWNWEKSDDIATIDGSEYVIVTATYTGTLAKGATTPDSLKQVWMAGTATNETCKALDGNGNGKYDILVFAQAVQTDGFTSAEQALDEAFGEEHPWPSATVTTNEALKTALTATDKTIRVDLGADLTYDVAAWQTYAMGGENTEKIIINGNGHKLTFNNTNGDWNNITTNGAKLVFNDVVLTNAGHNDGPWNRHNLNFACEVEMNNVTTDKAIALKAGAELNNVTIADANISATYAIWVQPNGQTVVIDGCTIDMLEATGGRGIKIDEQYVDVPEKVTLVVKNTTFKTEEKSAILVKSVAGADITLENVDISGCVADTTNAVWVDEASAAYASLVTVTGGTKIVEP